MQAFRPSRPRQKRIQIRSALCTESAMQYRAQSRFGGKSARLSPVWTGEMACLSSWPKLSPFTSTARPIFILTPHTPIRFRRTAPPARATRADQRHGQGGLRPGSRRGQCRCADALRAEGPSGSESASRGGASCAGDEPTAGGAAADRRRVGRPPLTASVSSAGGGSGPTVPDKGLIGRGADGLALGLGIRPFSLTYSIH